MTRIFLPAIAALAVLSFGSVAMADNDDPPLFVVATGSDVGNCQSVTAPCRTIAYALGQVGKTGQMGSDEKDTK